jgi:hypothetical protein
LALGRIATDAAIPILLIDLVGQVLGLVIDVLLSVLKFIRIVAALGVGSHVLLLGDDVFRVFEQILNAFDLGLQPLTLVLALQQAEQRFHLGDEGLLRLNRIAELALFEELCHVFQPAQYVGGAAFVLGTQEQFRPNGVRGPGRLADFVERAFKPFVVTLQLLLLRGKVDGVGSLTSRWLGGAFRRRRLISGRYWIIGYASAHPGQEQAADNQ